jgi:glycosyltransferase involved in cell wall biosynthesis
MPLESDMGLHPSNSNRVGTVSIVLCTFNGARFLSRQLASYLNQDRIPDELVIGDDGSTDETESLIVEFAKSAPFPVYFHRNPERLGVGSNFDQSIQRCSGEFIALSDQDDEWRPDKLSRLVTLLQQNPQAGYACSDAELIDETGKSLSSRLWEQYRCPPGSFLNSDSAAAARHLLFESDRILGATMLLRSVCIKNLSPIPATWVHDHWYSVLCELTDAHGVCTSEPVTLYRLHGQQTCGLRRPVGAYRQKKRDFSDRRAHRVRRRERLIDLRRHLVDRLIPNQPELARWLPQLDEADRIAEQAIIRDGYRWWRRKLERVKQWWSAGIVPGFRPHPQHGMDRT